jgi:hypothetical protein
MNTDESDRFGTEETTGELARALVGAGAAWARYGLTIARASLDASARTLEATAGVLGALSERIVERAESDAPDRTS